MSTLSKFNQQTKSQNNSHVSTFGKIVIGITGASAILLMAISLPFVSPALRKYCLPYVPATEAQLHNIALSLRNCTGNLVDLGSGDGRIVIEAAKRNFIAHGVELNPWLVFYSRIDAFRKGVGKETRFFMKDLWKFSLTPYNNIVIFGVDQMMPDLEKKVLVECRSDSNIIACRFPFPNLKPMEVIGNGMDTVWIYTINQTKL